MMGSFEIDDSYDDKQRKKTKKKKRQVPHNMSIKSSMASGMQMFAKQRES